MEDKRYYGNYLGIVVQNNDPLHRGRVKVFVPHISPTVYKDWVQDKADKQFKFLGRNIESDLENIVGELKEILPWAEVAAPLAGEMSSGRYNAQSSYATISDSSNPDFTKSGGNAGFGNENYDAIGEKPGNVFDNMKYRLSDAFNDPAAANINYVNKLSFNYVPECYSNSAKGTFAIPSVGAHVWVFFVQGNPLVPVVFAGSFGAADWCSIYDSSPDLPGQDYPGSYENNPGNRDINTDTYRNKYVINQKGGTIQFVNTDNRELLKMTHYSGSFKEFNNIANIELAVNNDQKLVLNDSFLTIRGTRNEFSQRDHDHVIRGDYYRKVGNLQVDLYSQWREVWREIADIKQLFDIQRTNGVQGALGAAGSLIKLNGPGQTQSGSPALCPVCSAALRADPGVNNTFDPPGYKRTSKPATITPEDGDNTHGKTLEGEYQVQYQDGTLATGVEGKVAVFKNDGQQVVVDRFGNVLQQTPGFLDGTYPCPACNNQGLAAGGQVVQIPGFSPSSFGGVWTPEPQKLDLVTKIAAKLPELAKLEAQMGIGGSEIIEITKHKIETIGTVMNDYGAVRVDPVGKMEPAYVIPVPKRTVVVNVPSPLVEAVQVDDLPGGTYSLNVCNRYNILVGAGGINIKSYGVVNISGAITTIAGEQVNIGSANEVNIDGGRRLSLTGDIVNIRQRNGEQVIVDSNLGISGNVVIRGGLYVEGDTGLQSVTYVSQQQQGIKQNVYGGGRQGVATGLNYTFDQASEFDADTGEVKPGRKTNDKVFMGYTDDKQVAAFLPKGTKMGFIPAGTKIGVASINIGSIPLPGGGSLDIGIKTGDVTTHADIDILAQANWDEVEPLTDTDERYKPIQVGEGAHFLGSGFKDRGDKPINLALRGLPSKYVQQYIELAKKTPSKAGWELPGETACSVTIGNGSHSSGVSNGTQAPMTSMIVGNRKATNEGVRKALGENGKMLKPYPIPANPAVHGNTNEEEISGEDEEYSPPSNIR